ncbi:hypothetical protein BGX34_011574 [Mortierella sp. NVP85]|nr:hypothetical protein BGX34_011574 [Mortierella sp. NVP85]
MGNCCQGSSSSTKHTQNGNDNAATTSSQGKDNEGQVPEDNGTASSLRDLGNLQKQSGGPQKEIDSRGSVTSVNDIKEIAQTLAIDTRTSGPSGREDERPQGAAQHQKEHSSVETILSGKGKPVIEDFPQGSNTDWDMQNQVLHQGHQDVGSDSQDVSSDPQEVHRQGSTSTNRLSHIRDGSDIDARVEQLKTKRLKVHGHAEYKLLRAKAKSGAADGPERVLIKMVEEFLRDPLKKVFLLTGAPGAGESAFSRWLECQLWDKYESSLDPIPLYINLPIDKPEEDMAAKLLQDAGFTEPQIRDMRHNRKFVLIYDGYDKNKHSENCYTSNRLNQPKEWRDQKVIGCSSSLEGNYLSRFHPRNPETDSSSLQEAEIIPFASSQQSLPQSKDRAMGNSPTVVEDSPHLQLTDLGPNKEQVLATTIDSMAHSRTEEKLFQTQGANPDTGFGFGSAQSQNDADVNGVQVTVEPSSATEDCKDADVNGVQVAVEPSLVTEDCEVHSCAYSPDGTSFIVGLDNGEINMYKTSSWERFRILKGHEDSVKCVAYSPKGDQIASASQDLTVKLWDSGSGSLLYTMVDHLDYVNCIAYHPQGYQAASASDDRTVRIWDTTTGKCLQTLSGHDGGVSCVTYSPNGKQIASASEDLTIRLWNVDTKEYKPVLSGHTGQVCDVAYSPQGDQVASASVDGTLRLWNVETGKCIFTINGHADGVLCVTFSPVGDQLASGGIDTTVKLWNVESGTCLGSLTGHSDPVMSVVYSPEGKQIFSGSRDKTVRLWNMPNQDQ